jgi:hypothetical protein
VGYYYFSFTHFSFFSLVGPHLLQTDLDSISSRRIMPHPRTAPPDDDGAALMAARADGSDFARARHGF